MKLRHFGFTKLIVADLEKSAAFYKEVAVDAGHRFVGGE